MSHKRSSSGETRLRILEYIARHGEASKWQLAQELKKSYSVVYKNTKRMLAHGFLKIAKAEPSEKNPKITVEYVGLTLAGLVEILNYEKPWEYIDEIAQAHSDKLQMKMIFGKWEFFRRKKLTEIIINRLRSAVFSYRIESPKMFLPYLVIGDHSDFETRAIEHYGEEKGKHCVHLMRSIVPSLTDKVLWIDLQPIPKEFIEAVIEDADFRQYYDQRFEEQRKTYKKEHNEFLESINWYQNMTSQV